MFVGPDLSLTMKRDRIESFAISRNFRIYKKIKD